MQTSVKSFLFFSFQVKKRKYWLYIVSIVSHIFAIVILFSAFLLINACAIFESTAPKNRYNLNAFRSSNSSTMDDSLIELNISMLIVGVVSVIVSLSYAIIVSLRLR